MARKPFIVVALSLGLLFWSVSARAYTPKPIYVKGYSAGSYINSSFSFDGGVDSLATQYGFDTAGGPRISQDISEYYDSGYSCTASDESIGERLDLYEDVGVTTYFGGGQVYSYSDDASQCISLTTGVQSGSGTFYTIGGSGKFTGASGSSTVYFTGQQLALPSYPGSGFFGSVQASFSGTSTP